MRIPSRGLVKGKNDLMTLFPQIAKEWVTEKNQGFTPDMVTTGSNEKVWWRCSSGHTWEAFICTRTRGAGCPYCANKRVLVGYNDLMTTYPNIAKEWNYNLNGDISPKDVTFGSNKQMWWICLKGHSYKCPVESRIRGRGCPICAGQKVLKGFNDLATVNPELASEWNYSRNAPLTPEQITSGTRRKVWWICKNNHEWEASIASRNHGFGCPYCSGRFAVTGENDLKTKNPELLMEWHPTKNGDLLPETLKPYSKTKVWWRCSKCGNEWEAFVAYRMAGNGCPACNRINRTSAPEQVIFYYIHLALPDAVNSFKPRWLSGHGQEFDIYIPCLKVVIEYDGVKWHKDVEKDRRKDMIAREHGLFMIRIREQGCPEIDSSMIINCYPNAYDIKYIEPILERLFAFFQSRDNTISAPIIDIDQDLPEIVASFTTNVAEKSLAIKYPDIAKEWNNEKNGHLTPSMVPSNSNRKMWWKCSTCQYEWQASVNNRIKRGCPACANKSIVVGQNDLATTNPEMLKYWDYDKNGGLLPNQVTAGSDKKIHWKCQNCGYEWIYECWNQKRHNTCSVCNNQVIWSGHNDFATRFPEITREWDYEKNVGIDPTRLAPSSKMKVWWKCLDCGNEWQALVGNRTKGHGCPQCARKVISKKNSKKVYCIETDKVYESISQAIVETGITSIGMCVNHKQKKAGGFSWEYVDET